ncbi:hypothetical protein M8494_25030 [Serratia ureilytica]
MPQADIVTLPAMQLVGHTSAAALRWGNWRPPSASCAATPGGSCCAAGAAGGGIRPHQPGDRPATPGNPRMAYTAALPDEGAMGSG